MGGEIQWEIGEQLYYTTVRPVEDLGDLVSDNRITYHVPYY